MKNFLFIFLTCISSVFISLSIIKQYPSLILGSTQNTDSQIRKEIVLVNEQPESGGNFNLASTKSTPSVVFIKTESSVQRRTWFFDPFGSIGKVSSSGSGVILSADGYLVTNHHVVKNADKIEVMLNNSKMAYEAKLVGAAPSTDLALLKIDAGDLQAIEFADSKKLKIGDWVLAVGNPFNLNSTVTAGIVSAKGRNINIVNSEFPIESFIQTDAAINPGNSGGALVNLEGKLVGINTAIASKTGSYIGYGFAIPANIVQKIVGDLRQYGQVQRAFVGLSVEDLRNESLQQLENIKYGVLVNRVISQNKEAKKFYPGDIIIQIDEQDIRTKSEYDEKLAYHRPGDKVQVVVLRNGNKKTLEITLLNASGTTALIKKTSFYSKDLGAELEWTNQLEQDKLNIGQGIKLVRIKPGVVQRMGLSEGFIITSVNGKSFDSLKAFENYLKNISGNIRILGVDKFGNKRSYSFFSY
ncbi:MAG: serine protease [Bacteroidetes bacterium MED-G17]|nr:MAG: serine protease [Bacteroidetes bacterium MED-G17]|tara:strand:+ start:4226 stop:5635 length:1410 start_codon:yes stop_codon:yes gene_type:complete